MSSKVEELKKRVYGDHLNEIDGVLDDIVDLLSKENTALKNTIWNFVAKVLIEKIEEKRD